MRLRDKGRKDLGKGALARMFELKRELMKEENASNQKALDSLGNELPLTNWQLVRTRALVNEVE